MAPLRGQARTLLRLLGVQATWSYERMQGVGMGWASEPVLARLLGRGSPRYSQALARACAFFNANPYLAAAAVGAEARAEHDGVAGPEVERLRSALCGPLGALGDRLFWTGIVPGLSGLAVLLVVTGAGLWAVVGLVVAYNVFRVALSARLLRLGWASGLGVGQAMQGSLLPRASTVANRVATLLTAAVLPLTGAWLLAGPPRSAFVLGGALVAGAVGLRWFLGPRVTGLRLTGIGAIIVIFWQLVLT